MTTSNQNCGRDELEIVDLWAAINRFLGDRIAQAKPFQWVADPEQIIAAVRRGHQALGSIH